MNKDLTEIAFILDRSGSMAACQEEAIAGFNEFLADQVKQPGHANLTLVLFDDQYEVPISSIPVAEVSKLDTTTFVPRGMTALLDAIGKTIDDLGERLARLPEARRPGGVIVPILTDGLENSSRQYALRDIADRIRHQSDKYNWQFLFLGAGQDAIATAASMNISRMNASSFVADGIGAHSAFFSMRRKTSAMRKSFAGMELDAEEAYSLASPVDNLVREEDSKRRGKDNSESSTSPNEVL